MRISDWSSDVCSSDLPLLAERVEVLRGPSALLFGSSAVGGVVNVIDRRIPRSVPSDGYRLDGLATYGPAAAERSLGRAGRSEERRVGKECVGTCRAWGGPDN